jgi:hypothetical protein
MRSVGLLLILVVLCLGGGLVGCKNKGEASSAPDPEALKAQQELIARRDKLLDARKKLQAERDKIDVEIKDIESKGGDATEQKAKLAELESQLETQSSELITMVSGKLDGIQASTDKATNIAGREAQIASREKMVAEREARVAEREKGLVQRDFESAQRWKEACSTGGTPLIIQQAAPKGGNYTQRDVGALVQKAKGLMAKKGIINSDLPGPAQNLESDATSAMKDGDMSKAYFAAAQLVASVEAIQVNRAFIQAKTARLQAQVKSTKLDEATKGELAAILGDVMNSYNNGDFGAANRRLNNLAAKLAKGG